MNKLVALLTPPPIMSFKSRWVRRVLIVPYIPICIVHDLIAMIRNAVAVWRQP
jgi:hypothetical protein